MLVARYLNLKVNMSRLNEETHSLLTKPVLEMLFFKNIYTTLNFIETSIKQIAIITGLPHKDILTIRRHIINKNSAIIETGLMYFNELLQKTAILPTGIQSVDKILKGGLLTGNVYEVCGFPNCGKTQFCLTILKNVADTLKQSVYIIDTKRDFSGKRIKTMLNSKNSSETEIINIMSKIFVFQICTKYELINCLYKIKEELSNGLKLRLIVIDSLPSLFYQSENYDKNYGIMNSFVNIMYFLASKFHIAFIVTNASIIWNENSTEIEKPIFAKLGLGKYWSNVPNSRFMLKKNIDTDVYQFLVMKSYKYPKEKQCTVRISDLGMY